MSDYGDIRLGDTIDIKFTTAEPDTGAPATLSGTPVISAYVGNSTTQITAGITLTTDFDGVTGLNNVRVVASGGNGYATATNIQLVITTGTVDGVSAVGYVVGTFSIENRSALMPTTAARTLDVASGGEAGVDFGNILLPVGAIPALGIIDNGTLQAVGATSAQLRSAAAFPDDQPIGATIVLTSGSNAGATALITDYVSSTDTATISAWSGGVTPTGTPTYIVFGTAPATGGGSAPTAAENAAAVWSESTRQLTSAQTFNLTGNVSGSVGSVTGAVGSVTAGVTLANDAVSAAALSAAAVAEIQSGLATAAAATAIEADTQDIQSRLPAALDNGFLTASVKRVGTTTITQSGTGGQEYGA